MADDDDVQRIIEVSINGADKEQCLVTKLQGEESLSGLYQFWVEVVVMKGSIPSIENDVDLLMKYSETTGGGRHAFKERTVKGFIASVVQLPHDLRDRSHPRRCYRILIVPRMWLSTRHSSFMHYEAMKHVDVVKKIAGNYTVSCVLKAGT
ncbi:MAG: hypothetical protein HRU15_09940, partial [Planctomycetes bacterium]|nr:hypothetical protein [Planctomycetota bacterium]